MRTMTMDLQGAIPKKTHGVYDIFSSAPFFVGKDMWGKHFSRRLEQCKWALGQRRCLCGSGGTRELSF